MFLVILLWLIIQGTDVAKAFLGGLAFKTLVAFQDAIQVGNRMTLCIGFKEYEGQVVHIGTFYVTLRRANMNSANTIRRMHRCKQKDFRQRERCLIR